MEIFISGVGRVFFAAAGGVLIGLTFLAQLALRDTFSGERIPVKAGLKWVGVSLRLIVAVIAFVTVVLVLRHVAFWQNGSLVDAAAVAGGLLGCVLVGRRWATSFACQLRQRLQNK